MTDFVTAEARIRQLHAHYTDAVWRKDAAAFANCFTADAEWRVDGMVMRGRDEITREFERTLAEVKRVLIGFNTPLLELTGAGRASGRTYVTEQYAWVQGPPTATIARYYEYYEEAADGWRISWRMFELLYSGPGNLTGRFIEGAMFAR